MNPTVKEKIDEVKALHAQARAIVDNPKSSNEDLTHAQKLLKRASALSDKAMRLAEIVNSAGDLQHDLQLYGGGSEIKGEPQGSEFKDWTQFIVSAWKASNPERYERKADKRLLIATGLDTDGPVEIKQMVESVGASGGFLVPTQFYSQLQAVSGEDSIVRPRATIIRMRRRQVDIPVLDQTDTTSGTPAWFGGMLAYWAEEAAEKTLTDPSFRQVSLVAHKLIMYTYGSDELVSDSAVSISDLLVGPLGFAGCCAWNEDYTFLRGSGAGQPLGILNAGATITVARQAGGTVSYTDLANMLENFLPNGRGVWVLSQTLRSELMRITDPNGNYIWQPNAREGLPQTIFGFPLIWTEKLPAAGSNGDVLLADFRYYLLGDRQATTIESTIYDRFRYDQTSWRAVHRVDGSPFLSTWITGADGSTISPFVILGAKAT